MALQDYQVKISETGEELLQHGTALFPIACYHDDLSVAPVPWHWHEELEAAVVTEGGAVLAVGMERYTLQPGEGFFINANVLHSVFMSGETCRLHSMSFHPRLIGGMDSIYWQKYVLPMLESGKPDLLILRKGGGWQQEALEETERAWQACVQEEAGYEFAVRESLSRLILLARGKGTPQEVQPVSEKAQRDNDRIKRMLRFIQQNLSSPITVAEIAAAAAVSESECLRCFRATIGSAPIHFLKQLRLQRAAALLAAGQEKISDIAEDCGFLDMSYFARSFRALYGCTPGEYRQRHRPAD